MAIIRPIRDSDIRYTTAKVENTTGEASVYYGKSVISASLCGNKESDSDFENNDIFNKSPYIALAMPIVNPFLSGKRPKVLKMVLGIDSEERMKEIINAEIIYDTESGEEIPIRQTNNTDRNYSNKLLIGGAYVRYLIDKLDVEEEIEREIDCDILQIAFKQMGRQFKGTYKNYGTLSIGNGQVHIVDNYYFNFLKGIEVDIKLFTEKVKAACRLCLDKRNVRLTYLLAIKEDKSVIRDQVMDNLYVLPYGYRPEFRGKQDSITVAYDNIVRNNKALQSLFMLQAVSVSKVRIAYMDLVRAISNLMTEKTNIYSKSYKPLLEMLTGKHGLIRDKMQGVRIDYSGRSVIISDPKMPLDTIGVPIDMLVKLLELDILKEARPYKGNKSGSALSNKEKWRLQKAQEIGERTFIVIGRQPTLFHLGMRAFKVKPVTGGAIILNPLSTVAFNADFDGDQMWACVAVSKEAKEEIINLMAPINNVFLARNGECHIAPRHEIVHGLWKASVTKADRPNSRKLAVSSYSELYEKVCSQEINIYDEVTVEGMTEPAGKAAIRACLTSRFRKIRLGAIPITEDPNIPEQPLTESYFKELDKYIVLNHKESFVQIIDKLVELGFKVSSIFAPSISAINPPKVDHFIKEFEDEVKVRQEYCNIGLESETSFQSYYSMKYRELENKMKKKLQQDLGEENGYMEMLNSGARGNKSNLLQLFGMKGLVLKNAMESFTAIIKHSLVQQLDGLEHGITAYGGRQGLIDKSIATYGPGYLSRKISHVTSPTYITVEDCGTTDGILIDYDFVKQFLSDTLSVDDEFFNNKSIKNLVIKLLVGRYVVGYEYMIENAEEASDFYDKYIASIDNDNKVIIKSGIKMRSPITCKNPCCVKCYGLSLTTNREAIVGEPVGAIASGSIGEPGTQLIMRNFKSGGVAGVKNLTSSFGLTNTYTHLTKQGQEGGLVNYDYISPVEGKIKTVSRGDGTKIVRIMAPNAKGVEVNKLQNKKVIVYDDVELKNYVKVGDTIQKKIGYMDMHEVMKYRGIEYAQKYLALLLFCIYEPEVFVSLKHFEIMVANMTFKVCTKGNEYFKTGRFYTLQEYYTHDRSGCDFFTTMKGVAQVPLFRNDVFSTMFLEKIQEGLSRSIVLSGRDEMKLPIIRYSFGLGLGFGSDVEGYVQRRGHR